jgi:hypothetical protein
MFQVPLATIKTIDSLESSNREIKAASAEASRSISAPSHMSENLIAASIQSVLAAIEIYNKPVFAYREQAFTILLINASQRQWLKKITQLGMHASPVMDRKYFHSIYFREPGGVLFEIATDGPGMAVDEAEEHLGETLALPQEYESLRASLERTLPPIVSPHLVRA